jgi:hypothetical protein
VSEQHRAGEQAGAAAVAVGEPVDVRDRVVRDRGQHGWRILFGTLLALGDPLAEVGHQGRHFRRGRILVDDVLQLVGD